MDTLDFQFGEAKIFEYFVIVEMKEGITVLPEHNAILEEVASKYFKDKPFGYITYRKNSYAVDPLVYLRTTKIENLAAFAVVSTDGLMLSNVEVEKIFFKKPMKHFHNLNRAKEWVIKIIQEQNKD